ncbi:NACHT, LRR and PYD domains-containing protein 3-like [Branchiostoma floridae]|uniref:NACHT, LRR and PYD domains-containing protein 3-like n=1 Tax=Branchiostoma floridae TaxID=7739 RepID=A0A9J7N8J4_BRAFL|nr:NACHT, LRR and PYD domains-containing protein 3-like [Branchiostoma floridae]
MSGTRPKVYARRSSSSSSDEETGALCRQSDSGELAVSSRDAQANQDGVQLSLACQQPGTVRGINYQVDGRDNVALQQGDNCTMAITGPLVQHVHVTNTNGTNVGYDDDDDDVSRHQTNPAAVDTLDDLKSLAICQTRHPPTRVRRPQLPSTEQLGWLKRHLKRHYRTTLGEFQPLPWFNDLHLQLKDVYTNLQIVRKDRADRDLPFRRSGRGETEEVSDGSYRDSRDDSGLIRIEQIFDVNRNGEILRIEDQGEFEDEETEKPKRIRIEGPPGMGKSIQCRKLAFDWSSDLFRQFDFAFLLQMRHFSGDVKDAIFDQLLPEDTEIDREELWSYIKQLTNQPNVLFILDGLDELKPQVRQTSDVIKLIQQRVMTDATVVVTSRPHECTADLKGCPLHCNIKGYTKSNSQEYIHKYFKGRPEIANSLLARIARNKSLVELASNPLNTMLLCIVWEDNNGSLPSTITGLFSSLVLCIVKRYCSKNDIAVNGTVIPENVHDELVELGRIAWEGLLRNEVNFDEADFKSVDRGTEMLKLGFLTKDLGASRIEASFVWSFLHKTFQEYIAAVFLSKDAEMQAVFGGTVPTGKSTYIPPQLSLVESCVSRQQACVSSNTPGSSFEDRVLQLLNNDNLHQVFLFLVGILKYKARAVFECFGSHLRVLSKSAGDATRNKYKFLFRFFIKCLIESENGSYLVRVLVFQQLSMFQISLVMCMMIHGLPV